ncbi:hypothetical protein SAMN06295926_104288 [Lysinibacillus sp. AC-3]|uniref:DUF6176 family protein n=1 Tax=unclassified Lysinibacillus TaxID=2636778 RepID=UPI0009D24DA5|nr:MULTISPECIES: DUF6176 family protein [unclassified Lysinibacillus]SKB61860.1 hypothetical protein SAMN06295926_104288 [Lysinibacillus sp. AC-3]
MDKQMYVETIFREVLNGEEYLYWYVVQGSGGIDVDELEHWIDKKHIEYWDDWIDKKHIEYWDDWIDKTFKPVDLQTEVVMIPEKVRNSMN